MGEVILNFMEVIQYLYEGFQLVLTPETIFFCFVGVFWGTVVGVLPGIGPMGGLALLLPLTFKLDSATSIILLAATFCGTMYGGSTTSILLNIPGEVASIVTCFDGYQMARKGRAGPALMIAGLGSFIGGTLSVVALMLFAPPLASIMLKIGPAEETSMLILALLIMSYVSRGSKLKTMAMILLGMWIATVGLDPFTGYTRFTFGYTGFTEGIGIVPIAIGLFGISEIMMNAENIVNVKVINPTFKTLIPRWKDIKDSALPIIRGSAIGVVAGFIPGIPHIVSTFLSYTVEKKISKHPEEFGTGRIEGVAGPESANNATTGTSLVPLFVLGIPAIPATAFFISALLIHGISPGPRFIIDHADVFWALIASMYLANVMLLILNVPLVGIFVQILRIPYLYLMPIIIVVAICGVYGANFHSVDLLTMAIFGAIGYILRKFEFDLGALIIGVVLGDKIEMSFRLSLAISEGSLGIFFRSTFAKIFVVSILILTLLQIIVWIFGFRQGDRKKI